MVSYSESSLSNFFECESKPGTGGAQRWRSAVNDWTIFFKITPRRHLGHIRLAYRHSAILDLAIEGLTEVSIVPGASEVLKVVYEVQDPYGNPAHPAYYRISRFPMPHVEHVCGSALRSECGTKSLFNSVSSIKECC